MAWKGWAAGGSHASAGSGCWRVALAATADFAAHGKAVGDALDAAQKAWAAWNDAHVRAMKAVREVHALRGEVVARFRHNMGAGIMRLGDRKQLDRFFPAMPAHATGGDGAADPEAGGVGDVPADTSAPPDTGHGPQGPASRTRRVDGPGRWPTPPPAGRRLVLNAFETRWCA